MTRPAPATGHDRQDHRPPLHHSTGLNSILGREPSSGETSYWTGRLRATSPLITVRELWYTDEAADLRLTAKYRLLLGRTPDAGEIGYWRGSEKQSDLATSIAFASSPEYFPLAPAAADARAVAEGATPDQPTP